MSCLENLFSLMVVLIFLAYTPDRCYFLSLWGFSVKLVNSLALSLVKKKRWMYAIYDKDVKFTQSLFYVGFLCVSNCVFVFQDNGRIGDEFMRQIESIAAYVPYMTCPGNHEWA